MSTMFPDELTLAGYEKERVASGMEHGSNELSSGGEAAFAELFRRYHKMVFNLSYRILGDREEALEVSQEVFLAVYSRIGRFRGDASLKTWIFRIAVNRASNRRRWWNRHRRRGTISLEQHLGAHDDRCLKEALAAPGETPEEALLAEERRSEIERTLLQLPMHQRVAVVLRDVEGLSYDEIADALQVSLGTVKSRIARGREELKNRLNGALG